MKDWIKELCPEIAEWQAELIAEEAKRGVEAEREACAQVCDENEKIQWEICEYCKALMATQIANIIRARGKNEN